MPVTIAQLETHTEAARSYVASGSYTLAIQEATAALAILGFLSNDSAGGASIDWNGARAGLEAMIAGAEKLRNRALRDASTGTGIQRTKIKWKRPS